METLNVAGINVSTLHGGLSSEVRGARLRELAADGPHQDRHGRPAWVSLMSRAMMAGANCQRASVIILLVRSDQVIQMGVD